MQSECLALFTMGALVFTSYSLARRPASYPSGVELADSAHDHSGGVAASRGPLAQHRLLTLWRLIS